MTDTPSEKLKSRWLNAVLPRVEAHGWTRETLRAGAEEAGLVGEDEAELLEGGAEELAALAVEPRRPGHRRDHQLLHLGGGGGRTRVENGNGTLYTRNNSFAKSRTRKNRSSCHFSQQEKRRKLSLLPRTIPNICM